MSKTIRRDRLMALAQAGKLELVQCQTYDDQDGGRTVRGPMPVHFSERGGDEIGGIGNPVCNLHSHDFTSSSGGAYVNDDGTIHLYVHSNCSFDFRLKDGASIRPANKGATKAKRPENARMQTFLKANGIDATPRYLHNGSMKGCWQVYNGAVKWTDELRDKLTALGFLDYDNQPLGKFSGNGGTFSVALRGHNELLACEEFRPLVNGGDYRGTTCAICDQKEAAHAK